MDTSQLHAILEESGLSPYQADAYVALLERGSTAASDLATASDVPQPRIYDVLRALEDEGYVTTYDRDRLYARANDPDRALTGLRTGIERYRSAITEIEDRYRAPAVENGEVSLVRQFRTVIEHAHETIETANEHVQLAATPEQFRDLRADLADAHDRGVHVQVSLYLPPEDALPFDRPVFEEVCTEVRRRDLPGPFLLLVDRQQVCFGTHEDHPEEYGVLVDEYTTAYVFHWYYLTRLWEVYDTVYDGRSRDPPYAFVEITDCLRHVEPLLHGGMDVFGHVEGTLVRTGRECTVSGRFVGVEYTGSTSTDAPTSLTQLAAKARLHFETDGHTHTIGGRGAHIEDIAGKRFVIERIEGPSNGRVS